MQRNADIKKVESVQDRYQTNNKSMSEKLLIYDRILKRLEVTKAEHKQELNNLKSVKASTINVLQFKLDEMSKKMKNEITRLSQEQKKHEESQFNESKRILAQIEFLKENNQTLTSVLDEFLHRVVVLEDELGPSD